jgi:hypothetical protein
MAVTEILGTDSLSSSRVTLNNNFLDVQDEIQDLQALLNPSTNTLSVNEITTGNITINATMGSGIATLLETTTTSLDVDGPTNLKKLIKKTGINGTASLSGTTSLPTTAADSTYFIDCSGTYGLTSQDDGTEVTLICVIDGVVDATSVAGASTINMVQHDTLTLRCINNEWYIISSFNCTIS